MPSRHAICWADGPASAPAREMPAAKAGLFMFFGGIAEAMPRYANPSQPWASEIPYMLD